MYVQKRELLGVITKWAISLSPQSLPLNLSEALLSILSAIENNQEFKPDEYGILEFKPDEFGAWLVDLIESIPQIQEWNKSTDNRISTAGLTANVLAEMLMFWEQFNRSIADTR